MRWLMQICIRSITTTLHINTLYDLLIYYHKYPNRSNVCKTCPLGELISCNLCGTANIYSGIFDDKFFFWGTKHSPPFGL